MLCGGIGFVGSGMYSHSAHIFSRSSRKVFENNTAAGAKEILQVVQNEQKAKSFFLLYPKFGHIFEKRWYLRVLDIQNVVTNCDHIEQYCAVYTEKSQPFSKKNLKTADFFV